MPRRRRFVAVFVKSLWPLVCVCVQLLTNIPSKMLVDLSLSSVNILLLVLLIGVFGFLVMIVVPWAFKEVRTKFFGGPKMDQRGPSPSGYGKYPVRPPMVRGPTSSRPAQLQRGSPNNQRQDRSNGYFRKTYGGEEYAYCSLLFNYLFIYLFSLKVEPASSR